MKPLAGVLAWMLLLFTGSLAAQEAALPRRALLKSAFDRLPIHFIENRGVYPGEVAYSIRGADKTLFFTNDGITFRLKGKDPAWVVKLEFVGANPQVRPRGEDRQRALISYFKGPEKDWNTGLRTYARVVYEDLWPGIDLVYKSTVDRIKYEFVVRPGADPAAIRLRYRGATSVEVTPRGGLDVGTPVGGFADCPPVAWQDADGERAPVKAAFAIMGRGAAGDVRVGFDVEAHDSTRRLILDPAVLVYCGYLGGPKGDQCKGIAVDAAGNSYVTGNTSSSDGAFPVKVGPDLSYNGSGVSPECDAFVAKVNASGTALVYCGYIGGSGRDYGNAVAVDAAGHAYVAGSTWSTQTTFPVKIGPDLTHNSTWYDGFVAKVNTAGTGLSYCGYIGGHSFDECRGIAVDTAGNAFVTGMTGSAGTFPIKVGPGLTHNGSYDAFVAKVIASGQGLAYCGYIGGSRDDYGYDIAVDAAGNAYVTGATASNQSTFPVKVGPDLTLNTTNPTAWHDAFVAKVGPSGASLVYCGYIGGALDDLGYGIAVDSSGNAYVAGGTTSNESSFPVRHGPDLTFNGGSDAFVAEVSATGQTLVYCGYIGGAGLEFAYDLALDTERNAYVTGDTNSTEITFPLVGGLDTTQNGGFDAFIAKVGTSRGVLAVCGFLGGSGREQGTGIAVDATGNAYVTGWTDSDENTFPVKTGPILSYAPSGDDGFVAKVAFVELRGSGAVRPGSTVSWTLTDSEGHGRAYQLGTSLGTGPIPIDTRQLDLSPDSLLLVTVNDYWPWIFSGYRGVMDAKGRAGAAVHIPNLPALAGLRLHSAFVTLDPGAPSGIRSISNTFTCSITR